jgi:hypothetical protein
MASERIVRSPVPGSIVITALALRSTRTSVPDASARIR